MRFLLRIVILAVTVAAFPFAPATNEDIATSLSTRQSGTLPKSFQWSSSNILVSPKNDGRGVKNIKDPSIVYYNGRYHVFASIYTTGYSLIYFSFTDFAQANSALFSYLDSTATGKGYRAAPQVLYHSSQKLWYLVYQNGNAAYSTNSDISNPAGWSAPRNFFTAQPDIIKRNIGNGNWVDMWVICDSADCHLFSSDDKGHLYRSSTTASQFPNGFGNGANTVIALQDSNRYALFEACNVYTVETNKYLLIVEAIGSGGRYFRSWTAASLSGTWTPLAASESQSFAGAANVKFSSTPWTKSISHGEVVRTNVDQTMTINPCNLRYLYQGINPSQNYGDYNALPYRLGLLTQTNSAC